MNYLILGLGLSALGLFGLVDMICKESTKSRQQQIHDTQVRSAFVMMVFYGGIMTVYYGGIIIGVAAIVIGGGYLFKNISMLFI